MKKKCNICNKKFVNKLSLGNHPCADTFLKTKSQAIKLKKYPLVVGYCNCSHLTSVYPVPSFQRYEKYDYSYTSDNSPVSRLHFKKIAHYISHRFKVDKNSFVVEAGSNDGTFLKLFSKSLNKIGCDPTAKKFKKFYPKSIKVFPKLFNKQTSKFIKGKFKLISCIAMFYDLSNPIEFLKLIEKKIDKNGIFHVEIAYLPLIYKTFSFDTFCQEHLTYYSFKSFENLIKNTNLKILDYEINSINGGSINFNLSLKNSKNKVHLQKLEKLRNFEKKNHYNNIKFVKTFFKQVKKNINKIKKSIKSLNGDVYGFGASTKGNVTLQLCNLNQNDIKKIYDINKNKFNCYTPGSKIKIVNEKKIIQDKPKYLIFLIWHFKKTIVQKIKKLKLKNTRFIWLFPNYKVTNK